MISSPWQWFLEPNNLRFLLGCGIALMLGMVIGTRIRKTKKRKGKSVRRNGDEAFFKGIQYILSNDHDHAIEEFTKSVQLNSETIETYVALGNLYRSKGDIERAIRIRQSIILRPNIDEEIKLSALFDLGVDYRNGGFLNRALSTFLKVTEKDVSNLRALEEIEKIHEELKDWENAYQTRKKISRLTKGNHAHILAHHSVELGKGFLEQEEYAKATTYFNRALSINEKCIDAYLHLGDLYFENQEYKKAVFTWKKVAQVAPRFTFLAYRRLEGAYSKMENLKPVEEFLKECTKLNSDAFTHLALARYLYNENDHDGTLREIDNALELDPNFWEARRFKGEILLSHGQEKEVLSDYRELIEYLDVPYLKSQCSECGFQPNELQWQCPQCKKWDTIHLIDSKKTRSSAISTKEDKGY